MVIGEPSISSLGISNNHYVPAVVLGLMVILYVRSLTSTQLLHQTLTMGLRTVFLMICKVWSFLCYCFRRQIRAVSIPNMYNIYQSYVHE